MENREIALSLFHNLPVRIAGPLTLECVAGRVWLTHTGMAGAAGDVFLHPGDRYAFDWPDSVLVEALGAARVVLLAPPSPFLPLRRAARFLLSSLHDGLRALRRFRRRDPLAG